MPRKADVFAFGTIMHLLLFRELPFEHLSDKLKINIKPKHQTNSIVCQALILDEQE